MKNKILYILLFFPLWMTAQNTNLGGFVSNEDGTPVGNVAVQLFDDQGQFIATAMTQNGRYTFDNLPSGYEYTLQLSKAGSPLNGLSTYDYVLIARHLLAVEVLSSPYQIAAADVDGSGHISISDMLYLRQLILGLSLELPQQRNWLFIAEDPVTPHPQQLNAFTFTLKGDSVMKNFLILKIGDLNKTAEYD